MFITKGGELLVNELAPRPHNSYHSSERACVTSQFEQAIRAVCNLPLGDVEVVQPAAIVNLLGDVWLNANAETGRALIWRWLFLGCDCICTKNMCRAQGEKWDICLRSARQRKRPCGMLWMRRADCNRHCDNIAWRKRKGRPGGLPFLVG